MSFGFRMIQCFAVPSPQLPADFVAAASALSQCHVRAARPAYSWDEKLGSPIEGSCLREYREVDWAPW